MRIANGRELKQVFSLSGTKSDDPLSPDYVPSTFHFTRSPLKRRKAAELCKYENRKEVTKRRKEQQKRHEAAAGLLDLAFIESAGIAATDSSCTDSADELEATCDNFYLCTSQYTKTANLIMKIRRVFRRGLGFSRNYFDFVHRRW
ncbi:uncharacterized protein LOC143244373 [Tachypleus tridentatus]|uniref:uncharacterized protein LOC143244373 n=1 Tax=Tachypleus tridentatus TaxID=6853 RepID=UPI003FCEF568